MVQPKLPDMSRSVVISYDQHTVSTRSAIFGRRTSPSLHCGIPPFGTLKQSAVRPPAFHLPEELPCRAALHKLSSLRVGDHAQRRASANRYDCSYFGVEVLFASSGVTDPFVTHTHTVCVRDLRFLPISKPNGNPGQLAHNRQPPKPHETRRTHRQTRSRRCFLR